MARQGALPDAWDLEEEDLDRHQSASGRRCPRELDASDDVRPGAMGGVARRALLGEAAEKSAGQEQDDREQAGWRWVG